MFELLAPIPVRTRGLLFCDIDGVLNSHSWYERRPPRHLFPSRKVHELDPAAVYMLGKFVELHNLHIVISSSWRKTHNAMEIDAFLRKSHSEWPWCILGITPCIRQPVENLRGSEINLWRETYAPNVPYVILDDDGDMHPDQPFVQTKMSVGLTTDDLSNVLTRLE